MRVEDLYQLQQIEMGMTSAQKRLNEIGTQLNNSESVNAARTLRDDAASKVPPLRTKQRNLELEIQSTQQKAKSTEEQLYSGTVKNPKTMQDMQHEIVALKRRVGELEDALLEVMVTLEDAEVQLQSAEDALGKATQESEHLNADLIREQASLTGKFAELKAKRESALKHIDPELLKAYTTLRQRRVPSPVALMQGRTCSVCGVEQTTSLAEEVRRGDRIVVCANCERILVYKI